MVRVTLETIANDISNILEKEKLCQESSSHVESGVFLFFSFDLSNSTLFKLEHPLLWGSVFSCFYSHILGELGVENYKTPDSEYDDSICVRRLWKLIGDEVLIYVHIRQVKQFYTQILSVNNAMQDMMEKIAEKVEKDIDENFSKDGKILQQNVKEVVLSMLGIKVTAWLAECYNNNIGNFPNIIYYPITTINGSRIDFLGREIDEGFRIAKYAVKNKIIVSPLLAWMIWKGAQEDEDNKKIIDANFKITSFISMKGVWRGRKVPIVMFHQQFIEFVKILEYDELDLDTYSNIREVGYDAFIVDKRFKVERIDNILKNIHREKEAERIYEELSKESDNEILSDNLITQQEFHLACLIFINDNELLIHKDTDRGYEFGCVKKVARSFPKNWKEFCEKGYEEKYKIKIKVQEYPVPIATYYYEKSSALGLIVMVDYDGNLDEIKNIESWSRMTIEEIRKINKENAVENFIENVERAIKLRGIDDNIKR